MNKKTRTSFISLAVVAALTALPVVAVSSAAYADPNDIATILADTNVAREGNGLTSLESNTDLDAVAQAWAEHMSSTGEGNVHNPNLNSEIPAGFSASAENIAFGIGSDAVVNAWLNSPGHYANIMYSDFTDIGIGYYVGEDSIPYAVQVFATYPPPVTVPDAPTNVEATQHVDGNIFGSWAAPAFNGNSEILFYNVILYNDTKDLEVSSATVGPDTLDFTFSSTLVSPGNNYSVRVKAMNIQGNSDTAISSTQVEIPAVTPSAVDTPVVSLSGSDVIVSWSYPVDGGAPITSYEVTLIHEEGGETQTVTLSGSEVSYTFTGLLPGDTYSANIVAFNVVGGSPVSNTSTSVVTPLLVPSLPQNVTIALEGADSISTSWSAPEADGGTVITGYVVTLTQLSNDAKTIKNVNASTTNYTFEDLIPGEDYSIDVIAKNIVGSSDRSYAVDTQRIPPVVTSKPAAPQGILSNEKEITVTWVVPTYNGGAEITSYVIVGTPTAGQGEIISTTTDGNVFEYVFDHLTADTTYTFTVRAVNEAGLSPVSNSSTPVVIPVAPVAPDAAVVTVNDITQDGATVNWNEPYNGGSGIIIYRIYITDSEGTLIDEHAVPFGTNSYVIPSSVGLTLATEYKAYVRVGNTVGFSANSNVVEFATLAEAPDAVTNIQSSATGSTTAAVTWDIPAYDGGKSIVNYKVNVYLSDGTTFVKTVNTALPSVNITGLTSGQDYLFGVIASNVDASSLEVKNAETIRTFSVASAPVNVVGVLDGESTIDVTWDAPLNDGGTPITSYLVTLTPATGTPIVQVIDSLFFETTFINLAPNTQYSVSVKAQNEVGDSTAGVGGVVTTPIVISSAPTNVVLTLDEVDSVVATWNAPTSLGGGTILGYTVTLIPEIGTPIIIEITGDVRTYEFTELNELTTYRVTVVATNQAGTSGSSIISNQVDTPPNHIPSFPATDSGLPAGSEGDVTVIVENNNAVVTIPDGIEGDWVYGVAYSTPTPLGWTQIKANGTAVWDLSTANLPAGEHKIAVYNTSDTLLGWAKFTLTVPSNAGNAAAENSLAATGDSLPVGWIVFGSIVLLLGVTLLVTTSRRNKMLQK